MDHRLEPTLADAVKEAGVSLATTSRVLNNRGYFSQATKDKVARTIKTLGYRPNQVARALHGKRIYTIGLTVPAAALPSFDEIAVAVENVFAESGYRVLACNSPGRSDRECDYLNPLIGNHVDGIISGVHNEDLEEYQLIRTPIVTIDRSLSPRIPNVHYGNEAGGKLVTERLLTGGSRCPALLISRPHGLNLRERGCHIICEVVGVEPIVFEVPFHTTPADHPALTAQCLDGTVGMIDPVFATDDLAAAEVLEWARQRDLLVPEQLRVVGFDGAVAVRRALPTLTTIRRLIEDMAREAVHLLLGRIDAMNSAPLEGGADIPKIGEIVEFPVEFLEGSTA